MRTCGFCKWLNDGICSKGYEVKPFEKISGFSRPKNCTKKQESATKKKQASDSWLNKKLDELWSEAVRGQGYCTRCFKRPPEVVLHAHHIFSRRHYSTRWDVQNGICLCTGCHLYYAHKDVQEFSDWLVEHYGADYIDDIRRKAHGTADYTKAEKLAMIAKIKGLLNDGADGTDSRN